MSQRYVEQDGRWVRKSYNKLVVILITLLALVSASAVSYGLWWSFQSHVATQCYHISLVDIGQGIEHYPVAYTTTGNLRITTDQVGWIASYIGREWCGSVDISNGDIPSVR